MSDWTLKKVLESLHDDIQHRLSLIRSTIQHPGTKGDASEKIWVDLFEKYLPQRYQAASAFVVDSRGTFSEQIDVVVFDRQYSPFIFNYEGKIIVPAESVYAVFEAKQSLNAGHITYAQAKIASVRKLHRTSLPIPHAGGTYPPKPLIPIIGGILTLESDWKPALGKSLLTALVDGKDEKLLQMGCVASEGYFYHDTQSGEFITHDGNKPATAFLFKLISQLQFSGTVPMIDIQAYGKWLLK